MLDPHVGEIAIFPYDFEPADWLRCDGQSLGIAKYPKLFSLLGVRYGGDGRQSFALPKLPPLQAAKSDLAVGYFIATDGVYPSRPPRGRDLPQ
jgi:microcystin-dependent protein